MNLYQSPVSYKTFNSAAFGRYVSGKKDIVYLDVRSKDEFENKHKDAFRNIGHLSDAVNIPVDELTGRLGELDKNKEYIVYGFAGGPEPFKAADILIKQGFSKINVLVGGIFNVRWTAANIKGQEGLKNFVVNIPESNL
jgi:rhodanese-related sulfurtransferase